MEAGEILAGEAAEIEIHHRQRIAETERRRRRRSRRETERAGLFLRHVRKNHVRLLRQRGVRAARHRHEFEPHAAERRNEAQHVLRLALIAEKKRKVALRAEAEVAVKRLHRVEENGRHARAVEGGGDLLADRYVLADAGKDQLAPLGDGARNGVDHRGEGSVERPRRIAECVRLQIETVPCLLQNGVVVELHVFNRCPHPLLSQPIIPC